MPSQRPQKPENKPDNALKIPQNSEAELSVLGSMLLDSSTIDTVNETITPDDFYNELNRQIFIAIKTLHEANKPVDLATLYGQLQNLKLLDDAGGIGYLTNLVQRLPSAQNVIRYARLIKDTALLRTVIQISDKARVQAQLPMDSVTDFINDLNQKVFQLTIADANRSYYTAKEVMESTFQLLETLHENKDQLPGVSSGFRDYDAMTAGFKPGTLTILAARPAMGKTALALNFLANAAVDKRVPSAFFSLEMTKEELGNRLLSSRARVTGESIRTGKMTDQEWARLVRSMEELMHAPIFVDETPAISITKLAAKARRLKTEHDLGLIVIDYLQLMTGSTYTPSREQEISEISRSLKGLSKELKLPIIALAQLNRGVEARNDKRPMLQDLRESGAIEQDADVINFIYRDDYYNKQSQKPGISEIIIAKQRSGKTGTVELKWLGQYTLFENPPIDPDSVY
ncbi:MAG: replicative DNA helicase [Proteobacteria bacterium]|nr:replicative DNA helicase [Pseudomonadota bacterium]